MQPGLQYSTSLIYHFTAEERSELQLTVYPPLTVSALTVAGIGRPSLYNDGNSFLLNRSVIIVKPLEWHLGN